MSSRSLNRIVLIGNLTRDPELKYTPTGTAICTFSVATNRNWTSSDGQVKEEVQYHRIVAWQKLAELCGKLLNKGRKVFVEGRMTYRTYTGKDGVQRTIAEIVLDDFIVFGDGKKVIISSEQEETIKTEVTKIEPPKEKSKEESVNPDDIPF
ncbi:single-stranded DNA-binding protein [Candidatus Roizmanbacteria bacterium CG06_land_8_20_14_3_00_34_14]|uniref:Single-stranded DNA-binding protein n=2 Tax=Candidatus Roizmaniibacteriota TaxID=1752723 RepID=A0A2M7AU59_9BACT|nr:MAG: single-stranded DNA-binding protein [Candidatus Roizmanbacteria bacterium CG07_land_8_20_14_0_80_34_15]PIU74103.1 MAG: single-stranded DNA-binding protein [Candidatus Roizmanbacteria bacterium CG06_land_8_20_14_3_00_34_14]